MNAPTLKTIGIRQIKPYWRNPRDNHAAVAKVKQSIEEYGYNQLIAVDQKDVIIAGHTRYRALQQLGWKEVTVQVLDLTEKQAKAYRIIDNKTAEFAKWTGADLATELRELGDVNMQSFFTEDLSELMAKSLGVDGLTDVTAADVAKKGTQLTERFGHGTESYKNAAKEVTCPKCAEVFYVTG